MKTDPTQSNYYLDYLQKKKNKIQSFYDHEAQRYASHWIPQNHYYYDQIKKLLSSIIPTGKKVLDIGCGIGHILDHLRPSYGVGIDLSPVMIQEAKKRYPHLIFHVMDAEEVDRLNTTFEYVVSANSITEATDIRLWLKNLYKVMSPETRLIIVSYNYLWKPILELGALWGMRPKSPTENWLSPQDFHGLLKLCDFEVIREGYRTILPRQLPILSHFLNGFLVRMPFFRRLGVTYYIVARPLIPFKNSDHMTVSVVVPCKNEEGNIEEVVTRIPNMGGATEIIFVDDKSTDGTAQKIKEQINAHPDKNIKMVNGPGQGKGAACRAGFAVAQNDVFMILDADMTVMPEVLPEFFEIIVNGKGEFINGSRLVYPMEEEAMRIANVFGNKMFAMLFTFLLDQPIKDTLCGTKVVLKRDYHKLIEARSYFGHIDRWGDYDWIFGAALHNLKIVELPVHYVRRKAGQTKMTGRLRNALIMLKMCWVAFRKLKLA